MLFLGTKDDNTKIFGNIKGNKSLVLTRNFLLKLISSNDK